MIKDVTIRDGHLKGIRSRNAKTRTLSPREGSQRSEFAMFNTLVLAPNVVSGEVDLFPTER